MLVKKGDPADDNNYSPICLQNTAYKLFASLLKPQFLDAGWSLHFGNPNLDSEKVDSQKMPSTLSLANLNKLVHVETVKLVFYRSST